MRPRPRQANSHCTCPACKRDFLVQPTVALSLILLSCSLHGYLVPCSSLQTWSRFSFKQGPLGAPGVRDAAGGGRNGEISHGERDSGCSPMAGRLPSFQSSTSLQTAAGRPSKAHGNDRSQAQVRLHAERALPAQIATCWPCASFQTPCSNVTCAECCVCVVICKGKT